MGDYCSIHSVPTGIKGQSGWKIIVEKIQKGNKTKLNKNETEMEKSSILLGFILVAGICVISAINQENKKEALYKRTSLILTFKKNSKQFEMTQG